MNDREVIELISEIGRLRHYIKVLSNQNKRIIQQNRKLQQDIRKMKRL